MMKRIIGMAAVVSLLMLCILLPRVEGVGMYSIQTYHWYAFVDTSDGTHYTTASGGLVVAYEADWTDSTGLGTNGAYYSTTADTGFYWGNLPTNVYDFVFRNDTDTLIVAQNVPVWGRTIGDSTITDSAQFKPDVVGTHAIRDWAVHTSHLDSAAVTKSKLATQSVDSTQLCTGAVHPHHIDQAEDYTMDSLGVQKIAIANTSEPALSISMTSISGTDNQAIDIVGGEALAAEEHWTGIRVKPDDLDPAGNDTRMRGVAINLSGVDTSNEPESFEGLRIVMPENEIALHITEGVVHHDYTVPSDAGAIFPVHDFAIDSDSLVATSEIHILSASTVGTPSGLVTMVGTFDEIAPIHQHIGTYATPAQDEFAGRKTGGGASWADSIDAFEIFVAKNDVIAVGSAAKFSALEVVMTTGGSKTVVPTFWFATAADTWTQFYPVDNTNGFQMTGTIYWDEDDLTSWANTGDPGAGETTAGYWVKVIRSGNPDPGTPTPTTVKTGTLTEYEWDKAGDLTVHDVACNALVPTSVTYPDNSLTGDGLTTIGGDIYIDTDPGSGWATLIQDEGAIQVKYNTSHFTEAIHGLVVAEDAISATQLKDVNSPSDNDIFTYLSSGGGGEWHTPSELGIFAFADLDSTYMVETTFPAGVTEEWKQYKPGATVGDQVCAFFWIGSTPYANPIGDDHTYTVSGSCAVSDSITCWRRPTIAKSGGTDRIGLFVIRGWPWTDQPY